jgi:phage nucleotide-binding protein
MTVKITSTQNTAIVNGIKMLVYGPSGVGKTYLCGTWDNPKTLILSAEGGMLTLQNKDIDSIEIRTMDDLGDAFEFLTGTEGGKYELICLDSISEIAEVCLADEMSKTKDGRKAYGELGNIMIRLIRAFRDLPGKHVLMVAKAEKAKDESTGTIMFSPSAPGNKLPQQLPFFFDVVMALQVETSEDGQVHRYLQTQSNERWIAKDRSSRLDKYEEADLAKIILKIGDK